MKTIGLLTLVFIMSSSINPARADKPNCNLNPIHPNCVDPVAIWKISNPDLEPTSRFGEYMQQIDGELFVAAAGDFHEWSEVTGTVYVLDAITGDYLRKITDPEPAAWHFFGWGMAERDGQLFIGAQGDAVNNTDQGAVYVIDKETGDLVRKMENPEPAPFAWYGWEIVHVRENVAVAALGAPSGGVQFTGAVYVHDRETGDLQFKIENPSPDMWENFGVGLAAVRGNIVVGNEMDLLGTGIVYVFDGRTGEPLITVENPDPTQCLGFGFRVQEFRKDFLVSCPYGGPGAVYLIDGNPRSETFGQVLVKYDNPDGVENWFGQSVEGVGNKVAVGAIRDNVWAGAVYLLDANTGALLKRIANPDPDDGDFFGYWITIVENGIAIGASGDDPEDDEGHRARNAGSVYFVNLDQLE